MTSDFHTPHPFGAAVTAAEFNGRLGELDAALGAAIAAGFVDTSTTLDAQAASGQKVLPVASTVGFIAGDAVWVGTPGSGLQETGVIASISAGVSLTLVANLASTHASGEPVSRSPAEIVDARGTYPTLGARLGGLAGMTLIDIRAFGASVASADNVVALQAALDYQKANGGIFYIPEGTFISSPLTYVAAASQALHILGAGRDRSILKAKAGTGTVLTMSGPTMSSTFRGFGVDGAGGTGHGLYYSSASGSNWLYMAAFEDLAFLNCAQKGLYIKVGFANRYVNIYADGNGQDQIKVWGGVGDYYERIDIGSTVAGYGGIRSLAGGTFMACNGIYDTANAAGPMFKFGGDGTAESDSQTVYPSVSIDGANVEAFTDTGIEFVSWDSPCRMENVNFATGDGSANVVAIQGATSSTQPLILSGCSFGLIGAASWKDGYAIHTGSPVLYEGSDATEAGHQTEAYRDSVATAYPINGNVSGIYNPKADLYAVVPSTLAGATDIAYLAAARLGNSKSGTDYVDRTAAGVMPTSGTYRRGDIVDNCSHAIAEQGGAGVKYTVAGWRRLTDGSGHTLNTDWVERRELTGN